MRRQIKITRSAKQLFLIAAAVGMMASGTGTAAAASVPRGQSGYGPGSEIQEQQPEAEAITAYNGDVNTLEAAKDASQLIVVVGNPADPAKGTLTWYQRGVDGALVNVLSVEAVTGMNGISKEKVEGDKKTPEGVYSFTTAFGLKENPGTILPYHQIQAGDHFVDDSNSRYYNQLVSDCEVVRDWNSSEDLIYHTPQYNYGLVLNYNPDRVPGKGSAIFLHCPKASNNTGTSGCISVPEDVMRQIAGSVDEKTKIVVVWQEQDLASY